MKAILCSIISISFLVLSACSSNDEPENTDVNVNYTVRIQTDDRRAPGQLILNPSVGIDNIDQRDMILFPEIAIEINSNATVGVEYEKFLRLQWQEKGGPYTQEDPFTPYTLSIVVTRNNDMSNAQEIEFNIDSAGSFPEHIFQF